LEEDYGWTSASNFFSSSSSSYNTALFLIILRPVVIITSANDVWAYYTYTVNFDSDSEYASIDPQSDVYTRFIVVVYVNVVGMWLGVYGAPGCLFSITLVSWFLFTVYKMYYFPCSR
jgi:hypothetical protein